MGQLTAHVQKMGWKQENWSEVSPDSFATYDVAWLVVFDAKLQILVHFVLKTNKGCVKVAL